MPSADYWRLAIDLHESRGEFAQAVEALAQASELKLLSADEQRARREQIEQAEQKAQAAIVPWEKAGEFLGKQIVVEGTVVVTNNIGNLCFLNFTTEYRDKFAVPVFKECFKHWDAPPQDFFKGKTIRVRGRVTKFRDNPQIEVHDPGQIEIVAGPTVAKAPAAEAAIATAASDIAWQDAAKHVGKTVSVTGQVVATKNIGSICFLNFEADHRGKFSVPVMEKCFREFPEPPETHFLNKPIRVTGKITLYKNAPQIEVTRAEQIAIIDESALALAERAAVDGATTAAEAIVEIGPAAAAKHNDRVAIVTGEIVEATTDDTGTRLRLKSGDAPPFYVWAPPEIARHALGDPRLTRGVVVRVAGRIARVVDGYGIVVHDADQVTRQSGSPVNKQAATTAPALTP